MKNENNPTETMLIHQYLYYVLMDPIWSDYEYDMFCKAHNLDGGGGSDRECDYPTYIVIKAKQMISNKEKSYEQQK